MELSFICFTYPSPPVPEGMPPPINGVNWEEKSCREFSLTSQIHTKPRLWFSRATFPRLVFQRGGGETSFFSFYSGWLYRKTGKGDAGERQMAFHLIIYITLSPFRRRLVKKFMLFVLAIFFFWEHFFLFLGMRLKFNQAFSFRKMIVRIKFQNVPLIFKINFFFCKSKCRTSSQCWSSIPMTIKCVWVSQATINKSYRTVLICLLDIHL